MKTGSKLARLIFALLAILLALGTPAAASTAVETTLTVWPTGSTACESGQIAVRVDNVTDLYAYDVYLEFTPGIINVTNVENGDFLEIGFEVPGPIDNNAGTLSYGLTQMNPQTPKTGSGNLIIVHFTVVQQNQSVNFQINAETDLVHAGDNAEIAYTTVNGTLNTSCLPQHMVFLPLIRR